MTTRSTRSPRRRTVVALAVVLAVLAGFIVRLVDIQIVNADDHIADSMQVALGASRTLYGTRGEIVDESGQTLAGSILLYDGVLDPKNVGPVTREDDDGKRVVVPWKDVAAEIGAVTGQTAEDVRKIVADALAENADSQFAYLKRGLTTEQYRALVDIGAPYLTFDAHPARTYPDGAVAGNLVGFMGIDGDPLAGIEQSQNDCLLATDGTLSFQKGKDGVVIPGTEVQQPAVDGGTLQLTINRDLQWYLQQLIGEQVQDMGAKRGTITVVEVKTGKVRAAAEFPSVDPNDPAASETENQYSHIFTDQFEPGSTFKALTAATVLDAGGQDLTSTVVASDWENFPNGARVTDAFNHPAYTYTLAGVLIDSSNAGISKFSERVSLQTRFDYLQKFGSRHRKRRRLRGGVEGTALPGRRVGQPAAVQHLLRTGSHDHGAGAGGRVRRDRQRGPSDAAVDRRILHQARRHRHHARPSRADPGDQRQDVGADARDPRERRVAGGLREAGGGARIPDRHQDRHR